MVSQFNTLDTIKTDKNICRVIPLEGNRYLLASYHLENGIKSGDLLEIEVGDNLKVVKTHSTFDFGILSIQKEGQAFSLGCSDGLVRIGDVHYKPPMADNCCLNHVTSDRYVASGHNGGQVMLYDRASTEILHELACH